MSTSRAEIKKELEEAAKHIAKRVDYNVKIAQEIKEVVQEQYSARAATVVRGRF